MPTGSLQALICGGTDYFGSHVHDIGACQAYAYYAPQTQHLASLDSRIGPLVEADLLKRDALARAFDAHAIPNALAWHRTGGHGNSGNH